MLALKNSLNAIGQYRSQILDWYLGWGSPGRLRFRRLVLWKLQSSKLQRSLLLLLGCLRCLRLVGILLCQGLMVKLKFYLRCNGRNLFVKDFSDIIVILEICDLLGNLVPLWLTSEILWDWIGKNWRCNLSLSLASRICNYQGWRCKPLSPVTHPGTVKALSIRCCCRSFTSIDGKVSRSEPIASTSTVRYKCPGPWTKLSMFLATPWLCTDSLQQPLLFFPLGLSQRDHPGPYSYRQSPTIIKLIFLTHQDTDAVNRINH